MYLVPMSFLLLCPTARGQERQNNKLILKPKYMALTALILNQFFCLSLSNQTTV
jgi:hypothetical protein